MFRKPDRRRGPSRTAGDIVPGTRMDAPSLHIHVPLPSPTITPCVQGKCCRQALELQADPARPAQVQQACTRDRLRGSRRFRNHEIQSVKALFLMTRREVEPRVWCAARGYLAAAAILALQKNSASR